MIGDKILVLQFSLCNPSVLSSLQPSHNGFRCLRVDHRIAIISHDPSLQLSIWIYLSNAQDRPSEHDEYDTTVNIVTDISLCPEI
jgi:hypothetical protein